LPMWQKPAQRPVGLLADDEHHLAVRLEPDKSHRRRGSRLAPACAPQAILASSSPLALISTTTDDLLAGLRRIDERVHDLRSRRWSGTACGLIARTRGSAAAETTSPLHARRERVVGPGARATSRSESVEKNAAIRPARRLRPARNVGYFRTGAGPDRQSPTGPDRSSGGPAAGYTALRSMSSSVTSFLEHVSGDGFPRLRSRTARLEAAAHQLAPPATGAGSRSHPRQFPGSRILVTRKGVVLDDLEPGEEVGQVRRDHVLERHEPARREGSGTGGRSGGTLTLANSVSPVLGSATMTARLSDRPEMNGETDVPDRRRAGVRTGVNPLPEQRLEPSLPPPAAVPSSAGSRCLIQPSVGSSPVGRKQRACLSASSRARSRVFSRI